VDDDGSSQNALLANQLDVSIGDGTFAVALSVGLEIAQVTNMADLVRWGAVCLSMWVEVRTSRCAAIGVVTELVNVHSSLGVRIVTTNVVCDSCGRGLRGLLESDSASDFRVSSENSNCFDHFDD